MSYADDDDDDDDIDKKNKQGAFGLPQSPTTPAVREPHHWQTMRMMMLVLMVMV